MSSGVAGRWAVFLAFFLAHGLLSSAQVTSDGGGLPSPIQDQVTRENPNLDPSGSNGGSNVSSTLISFDEDESATCSVARICDDGILLPAWRPVKNISNLDKAFRAIVYLLTMMYLFLGVSIIADRFMAAIEVITSQEREVTIQKPTGETIVVHVRTWNETVSNLTLMALGSSAPEILLSIIEIIGNGFKAGDLGPGTIVGSAAFNLFVIIGLCVAVIPNGETRRIKHLRVFIITASWSVFAYLWLYIIIALSSPGVVDVWEGILTFLFFPATVVSAYIADKKIFLGRFLSTKYRARLYSTAVVSEQRDNVEMGEKGSRDSIALQSDDVELKEFEKTRKEYIEILRELHKKNPDVGMRKLEEMAAVEVLNRGPKSRAFYRIQATRKLTGGGNIIKKKTERHESLDNVPVSTVDEAITRIFFEPGHYTVMENVGKFSLTVTRQGGNLDTTIYVDYRTEDGTANAGADYVYAEGTVVFFPGETQKQFQISIIDDDIFEEDEHFYVRLNNIRVDTSDPDTDAVKAQLVNPFMATVMILDDDHAGIFHFEHPEATFPESIGEASVRVVRSSGARGTVILPYRTIEGSAKGDGHDFDDEEGEVVFENDETE